jgi:hypothetical protein
MIVTGKNDGEEEAGPTSHGRQFPSSLRLPLRHDGLELARDFAFCLQYIYLVPPRPLGGGASVAVLLPPFESSSASSHLSLRILRSESRYGAPHPRSPQRFYFLNWLWLCHCRHHVSKGMLAAQHAREACIMHHALPIHCRAAARLWIGSASTFPARPLPAQLVAQSSSRLLPEAPKRSSSLLWTGRHKSQRVVSYRSTSNAPSCLSPSNTCSIHLSSHVLF